MKIIAHVPTQSYGFMSFEGTEKDLPKIEKYYNDYAEVPLKFKKGVFVETDTFTGEKVLYNQETHEYTDLDGNKLISGSQFKKQFDTVFDKEKILPLMEKKYNVKASVIGEIWEANSKISTTFGTAVHLAMEQYFKHRKNGCDEKEYHLPKQIFLRNVVDTFPLKDMEILPELMVSCLKKKMVGQIDGLVVTGDKQGYIVDYKTDAKIEDNLLGHFIQLSFYARILQEHGWVIEKVEVWNYTERWTAYVHEVIDVTKVTKESIKEFKKFKDKTYGDEKEEKKGSSKKPVAKEGSASDKSAGLPKSDGGSDKQPESAKK